MDEAHILTSGMAGILLDASQNIRGEDCPFFLVLAGTPNLETTLNQASATFWDKSSIFPLGRLSTEDAIQALTIPFNSCQVTCTEGVVEEIAHRAYNYPYFMKIWGDCIASRLFLTGSRKLKMDTVREAELAAVIKCTSIYRQRYNELDNMGFTLATDIASAFNESGNQYIPVQEFEKLVGMSLQNRDCRLVVK